MRCTKQFIGVAAGRGSGKTMLAKRRLVNSLPIIKEHPDPRYFYGAPTEQQAKRIAWQDLQDLTPKNWVRTINRSELYIDTIFGSRLYIIGLDKPQRIEGVQWDGCVLDESCDIKPDTFALNVLPTLVWRDGWCLRIGVPKRQGVGAAEFRKFCTEAGRQDTETFSWPSSDIVPPELLVQARERMDAKDYAEQFEASWVRVGSGIFHAFDEELNIRPCQYYPDMPIIVGSDFNVDPMCWVLGHWHPDRGVLEWFDEFFIRNTNTPETLTRFFNKYKGHRGGFQFYGDATGQARKTSASSSDYNHIRNHEGFKRLGRTVHYPRANPNVDDRFASCNAMFCNAAGKRKMFVDPRCDSLIDDLSIRSYRSGERVPDDSGDIGHMTDAIGYAVHWLFPVDLIIDYGTPTVVAQKGT